MKQLTFASILIAVAAVAFRLGASNHQTVSASGLAGTQGRFQIVQTTYMVVANGVDEHVSAPFLVDTATGRTWEYEGTATYPATENSNAFFALPGWQEASFQCTVLGADGKIYRKTYGLPAAVSGCVTIDKSGNVLDRTSGQVIRPNSK